MGILSGWMDKLKGNGEAQAAAPPSFASSFTTPATSSFTFTAPPQPQGEWSLIVDKNCDIVTNRAPAATDMLARKPVEYIDGGTLPKPDASNTPDGIAQRAAYEVRAKRNRDLLEKAVFILSQTEDGRRLLNLAKEKKFELVFDPAETAENNAAGLCDYQNRRVPLAEGRTAAEVALTVKHELQHMEDISKGLGYSFHDDPVSAIMVNRALEGNARVSEAVAAAEALHGTPRGPAQQFRTTALLENFWDKNAEMAQSANAALPDAGKHDWKSFAQKVLPAYYRSSVCDDYDERYAKMLLDKIRDIEGCKKRVAEYRPAAFDVENIKFAEQNIGPLFSRDGGWDGAKIASIVSVKGLDYLKGAAFDAGSETATAFSAKVKPLFEKLKKNIETILPHCGKGDILPEPKTEEESKHPPRPSNPYSGSSPLAAEKPETPIVTPDRIDGHRHTGTGAHENAVITTRFAEGMEDAKRHPGLKTDLDRVHVFLMSRAKDSGQNIRGTVGDYLKAGLLAPIAAFPPQYLQDLGARLQGTARAGADATGTGTLDPHEVRLIEHWQKLHASGADPVWGDPQTKNQSMLGDANKAFNNVIVRMTIAKQDGAKAAGLKM